MLHEFTHECLRNENVACIKLMGDRLSVVNACIVLIFLYQSMVHFFYAKSNSLDFLMRLHGG